MRKKIAGCMVAAMAATVMLAGCGKESVTEENIKEDIIEESASEEPKEEAVGEEVKETSEDIQEASIVIAQHPLSCSIEGKERATGNYPEIILSDELKGKYPKLADYVGLLNENWANYTKEHVANYAVWAQESLDYYDDPVFVCEESAWIGRIDERLVTILTGYYEDSGGAHPNHGSSSINVDPVTGNLIDINSLLADTSQFPSIVRNELEKAYPGICEEVDSFYFPNEGEPSDVFQQKLEANSYSWCLDDKGLSVFFSPYEIASYAAGDLEILISPEDYPGLIQSAYLKNEPQDINKISKVTQCPVETVEPMSDEPKEDTSAISNPTWKRYIKDGLQAGQDHISLTKIKEDKTDWLDTEVWAVKNGFEVAQQSYADDNYYYEPYYSRDFDYMSQCITIYDRDMTVTYHDIDLAEICNGPDEAEGRESAVTQYIRYAAIDGDVLYVEIGHQGYASEEPWSSYIVAIDLNTYEVLFRSEPLVGNGYNFKIVGDTIICGYGFTSEPDYIYLLDKHIGEKYDEIPVKSAPYQFEVKDDTLYVATYNTAYEFKINR